MSTLKDEVHNRVSAAQVVHHGASLVIPDGMTLDEAMGLLARRKEFENQEMEATATFDVFPWDGAVCLHNVLNERYGWAAAVPTRVDFGLFFQENPPKLISIECGPHRTMQVPWGSFLIPNVRGVLETQAVRKNGRFVFAITAKVKRSDEREVQALFNDLRIATETTSIYRGQAIRIRFRTDDGKQLPMPEPRFIDTAPIRPEMLVYNDAVQRAVNTNLFTPITRAQDCIDNGIPVKRGVILGGTYGTGKTLAAAVASKLAVQHGVTYIYVPRADELKDAIEFAKQYQSPASVVFCEDIDRAAAGERSVKMDDLLNTIDGIDSKNNNIIVVLTTNDMSKINPAMLRPGRLDAVIEVTKPDAKAVEKLLRLYAGPTLPESEDLTEAGKALAGNIPAVVAEAVKRAKLAQLALQEPGTRVERLTGAALSDAAALVAQQVSLVKRATEKEVHVPTPLEEAMAGAVRTGLNGHLELVRGLDKRVASIEERIG